MLVFLPEILPRPLTAARAVVVSLLVTVPAAAQTGVPPAPAPIVVSNPPKLPLKVDAWSGKGEVSYVATTGNADTSTAKLGAELQYKPGPTWAGFLRVAFLTSDAPSGERHHRLDGLARVSRRMSPRLETFAQVGYLKNTFAGITDSFYPLGGIAYSVVERAPHSLKGRVGLGYGQENRLRGINLNFPTADAESAYRWALSRTAELRQNAAFTANLRRRSDWRFANTTSLTATLNSLLSLKMSHVVNYLNEPVRGFEKVDTISSAAVVATF